ncbi:tumor necrosis factor receptor superfamily member 14 isoform 1-T2 [Hipposideros larvatus]
MELLPGWGPPTWCPVPKADALSLALYFLLLGSPHCTQAVPVCKEEEFPVRSQCCPKCSPGYHVKEACGEFTGTLCVPCTAGTFTAHLNGLSECLQCRVCDPAMGLVTRQKCSSTKNTVCSCDQGHFCVREDGDDCAECRPHSVCRPGQRVQERGTEWQDTVCADCLPGTFSPNGSLAECQLWTKCSSLLQVESNPGTSSTDAICSFWPLWVLLAVILLIAILGLFFLFTVTKYRKLLVFMLNVLGRVTDGGQKKTLQLSRSCRSHSPCQTSPQRPWRRQHPCPLRGINQLINGPRMHMTEPSPLHLIKAARPPRTKCGDQGAGGTHSWMP